MGRTARTKAKPKAKAPNPASPIADAVDADADHVEHAADQPDYSLYNVRFASFSNSANPWPHATPTPETLAAAGFYHDPFPDESPDSVNCFQCGKPLGDWDPDDDPYKEHVGHTTDCAWARAVCVPEMCRLQGPNPYDLNDPETWPAALERAREETFVGRWPHAGQKGFFATIKRMAKAGFHYTPEVPGDDCASCIYCGTTLSEWSPKDNPLIEHKNRQPDCPFFDRIAKVRGKRPAATAAPAAAPPPKRPRKPPASRTALPAASAVEDEPDRAARPGRKPPARSVGHTTKAPPPKPVDLVPDDEVDVPPIVPKDQESVNFAGDTMPADVDSHPPPVEDAVASGAANSDVGPPPPPSKARTLRRGRTATRTLLARRASRSAMASTGAALAEVLAPEPAPVADQSPTLAPVADEPVAMDVDEPAPPPRPPAEPEPQPDSAPVMTRTTRRGTRTVAASTRSTRRGRGRGRGRGGTRTVPALAAAVVEEEERGPAPDVDAAAVLPADEPAHDFAAPRAVVDAMDVDRADPFDHPSAFAPDPAPQPGQVQSRSRTPTRSSASSVRHPATPHARASAPATPAPVTPQSPVARPTQVLTPPAALPVTPSPAPHTAAAPSATPAARDAAALDQPDHVAHREPTPPPPPRTASPPPAKPKRAATKRRAPVRTAPPRVTRHRRALSPPPAAIVPGPVEESAPESPAVPVPEPVVESPVAPTLDSEPATESPAFDQRAHTPSPVARRQSSRRASEQRAPDALVPPPAVVSSAPRRPSQRRASHVDTGVAERVDEERDYDDAAASDIDETDHDPPQELAYDDSATAELEEPIHDVVEELALVVAEDLLGENVEKPARDATPVPASRRTSRQSVPRATPMIDHESRRSSMLVWHTTPALSMVDDDVELHVVEMDTAANDVSASSSPTRRRSSRIQARASKSPVIDVGDSVDEDGLAEQFEETRRAEPFREPAGSSSLSFVPQSSSLTSVPTTSVDADRESAADDTGVPEDEKPMDVDDDDEEEREEEEEFPDPDDMLPVTPALARFVTPARGRGQRGEFSALRFQVDPTAAAADTPTRPIRAAARRASTPAVTVAKPASALSAQARKLSTPMPSRRMSTPAPARISEPSDETGAESAPYAGPAFSTRRKTRLISPSAAPPPSHAPPPPPTPVRHGVRRHRSHTAPEPASTAGSVMLRYRVVEIEIPIYVRRGVRTPQQTPVPTPEPRIQELVGTDREDAVEEEEADGMGSGDEARVEVEKPELAAEPLDDEERESDEGEEREVSDEEDAVEERVKVEVPEVEAEEEREAAEEMNVAEERDAAKDAGEKTVATVGRRDGSFATKNLDMNDAASEPDLVLFLEDEPDTSFHGEDLPLHDHQDVAMDELEEPQELDEMAELDEMDELIDENDQDGELQAMADLHIADDLDTADELDADQVLDPADVDPMHVATSPSVSLVQIEDDADVAPSPFSPMQIEDKLPAPLMSPIHIEDEDGHPPSPIASSSTPTPTPTPFAPRGLSPAASMYESSSPTPTPTASRPSTRTGHASPAWRSSPTPSRRRPGSLGRTVPTIPVSPSPALRVPDQGEPMVFEVHGSATFDEDETAVTDEDEPSVADADLPAVQLPSSEPQGAVAANGLDHVSDVVMDEAAYADMVDPYTEARAAIATMDPTIRAQLARAARACDPAERKLTVRKWLAVVAERRKQVYRAQVQEMIDDLYRKAREADIDLDPPLP